MAEIIQFDLDPVPETAPVVEFDLDPPSDTAVVEFDLDEAGPQLAHPENLAPSIPAQATTPEGPGVVEQIINIPKVFRVTGAETGLTTAGGFEAGRASALRKAAKSPVGLEGRLVGMKSMTPEERIATAIDRANELSARRADESAQEYFNAAGDVAGDYGLDPRLETGLITQAARGLAKGAGMYAVAAAGGIPALALQGSTEAYGAAKAAGKSDDEADKESTRALIGLAIFGGANKAVATGIARRLGDASKLRTFLVQTMGQAAGNEATSRAISAYEAALDAEPGKRLDAAVEAISKNDAATIALNFGFAITGGLGATGKSIRTNRNELRLGQVAAENIRRGRAEQERVDRVIAEQNAAAARLGEQRVEQGAEFVQPSAEALTPEQRARAEAAPPIVTGAPAPAVAQQGQQEPEVDLQAGVVRDPDGTLRVVDETGATEVVPDSPVDKSITALGLKEKGAEAVAGTPPAKAQPEVSPNDFVPALLIGETVVRGQKGDTHKTIYDRYVAEHGKEGKEFEAAALALADDAAHIFESSDGQPMTRVEVSEALGEKIPMQSERLRVLQEETTKAAEPAPEPTVPEEPVDAGPPGPPPETPTGIPEDRGRAPLPTPTGPRNAITEANRFLQGLPPRAEPLRKTSPEVLANAMEMIDKEPNIGSRLVKEINQKPRALTPEELAVVAREQVTRENEYNAAIDAINSAPNEAARRDAENRLTAAREANQEAYDAMEQAGTPAGQNLAFRKFMLNKDYTLARMEAELTALKPPKNAAETARLHEEVKGLYERIKKTEDRARLAEELLSRQQGEKEFAKLLRGARLESSAARKEGKSILDRIISSGEEAQKRIRERNLKAAREGVRMQFLPFNLLDFPDHVLVGAGYIAKGVKSIGEFTKRLTDDFGPDAEQHAPRIYEASQKYLQEAQAVGPKIRTVDEAMARDKAGEPLDPNVVYEVARGHVNAGVEGFDPVMQATTKSLQANHPDVTAREVRDAFSGYGKVTRPSQAADRVKLREYRRLAQLQSAIDDALKKIAPMKSGPQRDKATEAVRAKMAELKRVMEENGIETTSPEQQLANAETAARTRLTNTIESLERQIATKTRDEVSKGRKVASPELDKLRTRVEELRKTLDEVAPRPEMTDAERIDRSVAAVEKRIAELDNQLKTGAAPEAKAKGPTSPKLERLQAERDAMNKLVRDLRESKSSGKTPEQRKIDQAIKSVDKQIAELDRQLQTGDVQVKSTERQVSSPELDRKRAERDAMVQLRSELRNLSRPKLTADERAIRAVRKSIELLDQQIKAGGARVPRGTAPEPSMALEALRSERDSMRQFLAELREAGKTRRTPEEIALSRYKKTLETRTKALQDRMAKGDYAKKTRSERELDKEAIDARFQYQKAKDAFEQKAFEYDLARRDGLQRSYDFALEVLNTSRSIMTSFDLSAPLRQGAFITLGHPIRSLKLFPGMFRAAGLSPGAAREGVKEVFRTGNPFKYFKAAGEHGEKMAYALQESLSDPTIRPNAALYRQAGLDLTDTGTNVSRRKMEEAYQSRFARKIPIVAGSQRAYTAFLNQLRADSFDSMVKYLGKNNKVTDAEAKAIASFINGATGRVKFPGGLEQSTQALNAIFFAPKYVASRFKLALDPITGFSLSAGAKGSARVRAAMAWETSRFLIGASIVLGLAKLAGAEVETDPRSSDSYAIKIGNTRIDILGGIKQIVTLAARQWTGETKSLKTGKVEKLSGPERLKALDTFTEYKLAPVFGSGRAFISGEDAVGNKITKTGALMQLATPLPFGDIVDAMVEQGIPRGIALSIVAEFGASMGTFDAKKKKPKTAKQPWETLAQDFRKIQKRPLEGRRGGR